MNQIMPKVVPDQKEKFENDELFRKLGREAEVKYTGHLDRPHEERKVKFRSECSEGCIFIAYPNTGQNLALSLTTNAWSDNPEDRIPTKEFVDFEKEPGKVHLKSQFIFNGVCVCWKGWIDLQRLDGAGQLEYDEERARVEDVELREQLQRYNQQRQFNEQRQQQPSHRRPGGGGDERAGGGGVEATSTTTAVARGSGTDTSDIWPSKRMRRYGDIASTASASATSHASSTITTDHSTIHHTSQGGNGSSHPQHHHHHHPSPSTSSTLLSSMHGIDSISHIGGGSLTGSGGLQSLGLGGGPLSTLDIIKSESSAFGTVGAGALSSSLLDTKVTSGFGSLGSALDSLKTTDTTYHGSLLLDTRPTGIFGSTLDATSFIDTKFSSLGASALLDSSKSTLDSYTSQMGRLPLDIKTESYGSLGRSSSLDTYGYMGRSSLDIKTDPYRPIGRSALDSPMSIGHHSSMTNISSMFPQSMGSTSTLGSMGGMGSLSSFNPVHHSSVHHHPSSPHHSQYHTPMGGGMQYPHPPVPPGSMGIRPMNTMTSGGNGDHRGNWE